MRWLLVTILGLYVAGLSSARAQDCAGPSPSECPLLNRAKAIFVGTVIEDDKDSPTLRFRVTEAFKGVNGDYIDLSKYVYQFHFRLGQQYLVFAIPCVWQGAGRQCLTISDCSGTRAAMYAGAIVEQLRAEKTGKRVASVYGTLESKKGEEGRDWEEGYRRALPDILIRLRSDKNSFSARTDEHGAYAFNRVPPGKYQVSAELPPGLELGNEIGNDPIEPFELPRSCCFENDLYALPSGRISGKVIGPDGKPLHLAVANLYLAGRYEAGGHGSFSLQGKGSPRSEWKPFEFYHLPVGDYVLVFNPRNEEDPDAPFLTTFYPDATNLKSSQIIHLADGQQLSDADIHVSDPLPTRQITVHLIWGGKQPEDFFPPQLIVSANHGKNPFPEETSRFVYTLNLLLSARYAVHAEAFCQMGTTGKAITDDQTVDGSDLSVSQITLEFRLGECVRK
jgi:hypothetical protein